MQDITIINKNEDNPLVVPTPNFETNEKQKKNNKRKKELADLSIQQ